MTSNDVIRYLKKNSSPKDREGMARFGINHEFALGVRVPVLRGLAKKIGKDHKLADELWESKIHEAKILATMIDESEKVTAKQMDEWVRGFNSWDLCDQCCMNLFWELPAAWKKAAEWADCDEEFVRRAGFALMACLAVKDKTAKDSDFIKLFPLVRKYSIDNRNFVKKAVNWALRQIGKRNDNLKNKAIATAEQILRIDSISARWIAKDAIRELRSR